MLKFLLVLLLALFSATAYGEQPSALPSDSTSSCSLSNAHNYQKNQLLIQVCPTLASLEGSALKQQLAARAASIGQEISLESIGKLFAQDILAQNSQKKLEMGLDRWYLAKFPEYVDAREQLSKIKSLDCIEQVELNQLTSSAISVGQNKDELQSAISSTSACFPNCPPADPQFPFQWYLKNLNTGEIDIDITSAWQHQLGSTQMLVAVISTGVQTSHPDLASKLAPSSLWRDFVNSPPTTNCGSVGCCNLNQDDCDANEDNDPSDAAGIGTMQAGIIGAATDNGLGVSGICPNCKILPIRAGYLVARTPFETIIGYALSDLIQGIVYAADRGSKIIEIGFPSNRITSSGCEALGILYAQQLGSLVIAGAGDDTLQGRFYPASYDEVIGVGATDKFDYPLSHTNYGTGVVQVSAPGDTITTTTLGSTYGDLNGTVAASAIVSGLAGLVGSHTLGLGSSEISRILRTAVDPVKITGGLMGSGRVDAGKALTTVARVPADFANVSQAIAAVPNQGTVLVSPGSYTGTFGFSGKTVNVLSLGGPQDTTLVLDPSGPEVQPGILFWSGSGASRVEGFTIELRGSSYPAIMAAQDSLPEVVGNVIRTPGYRAIMAFDNAQPTITGNTFEPIIPGDIAGGIDLYDQASATITANKFFRTQSPIKIQNSTAKFHIIENNLLANSTNPGIDITNGSADVINNTLVAGTSDGIALHGFLGGNIKNNIIANNLGFGLAYYGAPAGQHTYNNFWQNGSADLFGTAMAISEQRFDPFFDTSGQYRLRPGSMCMNAGDPSDSVGEEPLPNGGRIDLGWQGGTSAAEWSAKNIGYSTDFNQPALTGWSIDNDPLDGQPAWKINEETLAPKFPISAQLNGLKALLNQLILPRYYHLNFDIQTTDFGGNSFGIYLGYIDANNYILLRRDSYVSASACDAYWSIQQVINGTLLVDDQKIGERGSHLTVDLLPGTTGTTDNLAIYRDGFLDTPLFFEAVELAPRGKLGMVAYGTDSFVRFDNILIESVTAPPPKSPRKLPGDHITESR